MGEPIRVVARVRARAGQEGAVREVLEGLLSPTRREPGCRRYELHVSVSDPADFVFVEEWASEADLDAHLTTPHVQAALARVGTLLAAPPELGRYRLIG